MTIWSDGSWISFIVDEAINSTKFIWFLKIMGSWLKSHDCFVYSKIAIILDNWAIHKSSTTRNWLEKIGCTIFFIPAYSPDFAPMEFWFSIFKRKLTELLNKEQEKIKLKYNYTKIHDSLIHIKADTVRNLFSKFFKTIKEYL